MINRMNDTDTAPAAVSRRCNCENGDSVMVFIHVQELEDIYSASDALKNGTLYPELNKPFYMGGCIRYE